jgi:hypothetical protein
MQASSSVASPSSLVDRHLLFLPHEKVRAKRRKKPLSNVGCPDGVCVSLAAEKHSVIILDVAKQRILFDISFERKMMDTSNSFMIMSPLHRWVSAA